MKSLFSLVTLTVLWRLHAAFAKPASCPLLGRAYSPPVQLSKEPAFRAAVKEIEGYFSKDLTALPFNETTFSVAIFSASEHNLWQWHHPSDDLTARTHTSGKPVVDGNSVYEIGSVSKLLTVYMWLITQGDRAFSHSIVEYIPELLELSQQWNPLTPDWSEITVGDLAAQMGGLARDYGLNDLAVSFTQASGVSKSSVEAAFPKLKPEEIPTCGWSPSGGGFVTCSVQEYLQGVVTESPVFPVAYTPVYSNEGFALLGVALEKIAHKALRSILEESLVQPLGLTGTYAESPNVTNHDVIPGSALRTGWKEIFGPWAGAGGFFTTADDFIKIGQSILNSQLLSKSTTNRWLKPASFVESFEKGVGRPWEIFRLTVHGQTVDVYSKSGDVGVYSSLFALIPQYDIGITILTAFDVGSGVGDQVRDAIAGAILEILPPVVDDISQAQAKANFAGTYSSTATNSSLTIEANSDGLVVTAWINRDVDIFKEIFAKAAAPDIDYRILPNGLYEGDQVGFTSFYQSSAKATSPLLDCFGWLLVDELTLGNIPLGQMVFDVDKSGRAVAVKTRAFSTILKRQA